MQVELRLLVLYCVSLAFLFEQPKTAFCQIPGARSTPIPLAIITEAKRRLIPLSAVKLRGRHWIACLQNHLREESCITLGEDLLSQNKDDGAKSTIVNVSKSLRLRYGDRMLIEQYGKQTREYSILPGPQLLSFAADIGTLVCEADEFVSFEMRSDREARVVATGRDGERMVDSLPRFRREGDRLVRTSDVGLVTGYMEQHPNEPFLLVVTVPGHCEPCRRMDQMIQKTHEIDRPGATKIKTFILEYFSFSDAERAVLGQGAVFPTTLVFQQVSDRTPRSLPSLAIGVSPSNSLAVLSKKLSEKFMRGVPSAIARGVLSPESLQELIQTVAVN